MNAFAKSFLSLILILTIITLVSPVYAQGGDEEACTQLVSSALELSREVCDETGRNQACYGNITLEVEPQLGISDLEFDERGDITDVEAVRTIQLSSMNSEANEWGVAYMQLQANIEDEAEQNITLLMFGEVLIENAIEPTPDPILIEVTATSNANVRGGPSTGNPVVGSVAFNDVIVANGRLEDNSWLRIQLDNDELGWIFTQLVSTEDDIEALDILDKDGEPLSPKISPMQAFYIQTGVDDAPCELAPDSGLLVQTPEGVAQITLNINEVDIRLNATAYVQSQPNSDMIFSVVDGSARVTAQGQSVFVPAGTLVRIPMDANNSPQSPPSDIEAYANSSMVTLPVNYLPQSITIAAALTEEEIEDASSSIDGVWVIVEGFSECGIHENTPIGYNVELTTLPNGNVRYHGEDWGERERILVLQDDGNYLWSTDGIGIEPTIQLLVIDSGTLELYETWSTCPRTTTYSRE